MSDLIIDGRTLHVLAVERGGTWIAYAVTAAQGERVGAAMSGSTADEAQARLQRWLEWQHAHARALVELQDAERTYDRAVADEAFAGTPQAATSLQARRTALDLMDAARVKLDEVRARQPE